MRYTRTSWPGARLPHMWLKDGRALPELLGLTSYTLLRLGRSREDVRPLEHAFQLFRGPLSVLDVPDDAMRDAYGQDLILVRADLHVVWGATACLGTRSEKGATGIAAWGRGTSCKGRPRWDRCRAGQPSSMREGSGDGGRSIHDDDA